MMPKTHLIDAGRVDPSLDLKQHSTQLSNALVRSAISNEATYLLVGRVGKEMASALSAAELRLRCRRLAHRAVDDWLNCLTGQSNELKLWEHDRTGRPVVIAGEGYLSLSYSADYFLIGWSNEPLGLDLEHTLPNAYNEALLHYVCDASEREAILQSVDSVGSFFRYWTAKEAVMKWQGYWPSGTPAALPVGFPMAVAPDKTRLQIKSGVIEPGLIYSLATENERPIELIRLCAEVA